jgi:hypothetical protein
MQLSKIEMGPNFSLTDVWYFSSDMDKLERGLLLGVSLTISIYIGGRVAVK